MSMFKQATSISNFPFTFIGTDGGVVTSGTTWGYYSHASGTQAALGGTISHLGNGQWIYNFASTTETNSTLVGFLFRHATASPVHFTIPTTTKLVSELADIGTAAVTSAVWGNTTRTLTGAVVAGTVSDKTGYTAIVTSGTVTSGTVTMVLNSVVAGTVSDKTGYTAVVTSGTITSLPAVLVGTNNDKTGYTAIVTSGTVTSGTINTLTGTVNAIFSGTVTLTSPVVVGTNLDKTGYSGSFSGTVAVGGPVVVGTNNDKTGYSGIVTSGTVTMVINSVVTGTNLDKTGYSISGTAYTSVAITPLSAIVSSPIAVQRDANLYRNTVGSLAFTCVDQTGAQVNLTGKDVRLYAYYGDEPNYYTQFTLSGTSVVITGTNIATVTYGTSQTNTAFNGKMILRNVTDGMVLSQGNFRILDTVG